MKPTTLILAFISLAAASPSERNRENALVERGHRWKCWTACWGHHEEETWENYRCPNKWYCFSQARLQRGGLI